MGDSLGTQLVGCAILGIGIWAFVEKNRFAQKEISDLYDVLFDASIILIMVGIAAFIITFAGCVGALRENTCLLMTVRILLDKTPVSS